MRLRGCGKQFIRTDNLGCIVDGRRKRQVSVRPADPSESAVLPQESMKEEVVRNRRRPKSDDLTRGVDPGGFRPKDARTRSVDRRRNASVVQKGVLSGGSWETGVRGTVSAD